MRRRDFHYALFLGQPSVVEGEHFVISVESLEFGEEAPVFGKESLLFLRVGVLFLHALFHFAQGILVLEETLDFFNQIFKLASNALPL